MTGNVNQIDVGDGYVKAKDVKLVYRIKLKQGNIKVKEFTNKVKIYQLMKTYLVVSLLVIFKQ